MEIGEYLRRQMNFRKLAKALRALRALNLVVVKRGPDIDDVLELHPMVREFVRKRFTPHERLSYIDAIIRVYQRFIGDNRPGLSRRPPLSILQRWTQSAELAIEAGKFDEAFSTLAEVGNPFESSGYPREFTRVARLLLSSVDWAADHRKFGSFEAVFALQVDILGYLGEYQEIHDLLEIYRSTVPEKDSRYINYCRMRCSLEWVRGEFGEAVEWGKIGQALKSSGVDTTYNVSHILALAERDAGRPESALPMFLEGRPLSKVTDPDELDDDMNGAYYGNIGRCLQFMGQIDSALTCYQKSALLLEKHAGKELFVNQGFVRSWVGEVFVARQQLRLAHVFFRAAYIKWKDVSPPRATNVTKLLNQIQARILADVAIGDAEVEKICMNWILGRKVDDRFR